MHASKKDSVDAASLASLWGPRLLRFYLLLGANQELAESLAIETLAEIVRTGRGTRPVVLVRLALMKAAALPTASLSGEDRIACAVASLPRTQGVVVALVRGMGLDITDVAEATRMGIPEAKRLFTDALVELHRLLINNHKVGDIQ
jgi:hypothetical protein